jgi:hypothetical protein
VALPFTLKGILRAKKNYENSNISPCKNIIFCKKFSKRNQTPLRYHNSIILMIEICFRSPTITKVVEYDQGFSYVYLDEHDKCVRMDVYVMPQAKWVHHVNFDNLA